MATANFGASYRAVRTSEGGNVDDPDDHGGRTSRGITQREYDAWREERKLPKQDVWTAPEKDIEAIYREEYWNPNCDLMPIGIDYMYFNTAVLAGPHRATIILQRALGVTDDGRIGPITRRAIRNANGASLVEKFKVYSDAFYRSLHQAKYTKGWLARNNEMRHTALRMIRGEV